MNFQVILLLLISWYPLNSVCALKTDSNYQYANISEFHCYNDGVCLPLWPPYNNKIAPYRSMSVNIYRPQRMVLRKVDVFQSFVSLDMFKGDLVWVERRLRLNRSGSDSNWINVHESYRDKLWIPRPLNSNVKSTKTKENFTPQTGIKFGKKNQCHLKKKLLSHRYCGVDLWS